MAATSDPLTRYLRVSDEMRHHVETMDLIAAKHALDVLRELESQHPDLPKRAYQHRRNKKV